jgi:predicted CopG family antitoxin
MYVHVYYMATKSITITNEAYERLASCKGPKDSFSDVVNKLTSKHSFLDLVGVLSPAEAKEIGSHIKNMQKRIRKKLDQTASELQ